MTQEVEPTIKTTRESPKRPVGRPPNHSRPIPLPTAPGPEGTSPHNSSPGRRILRPRPSGASTGALVNGQLDSSPNRSDKTAHLDGSGKEGLETGHVSRNEPAALAAESVPGSGSREEKSKKRKSKERETPPDEQDVALGIVGKRQKKKDKGETSTIPGVAGAKTLKGSDQPELVDSGNVQAGMETSPQEPGLNTSTAASVLSDNQKQGVLASDPYPRSIPPLTITVNPQASGIASAVTSTAFETTSATSSRSSLSTPASETSPYPIRNAPPAHFIPHPHPHPPIPPNLHHPAPLPVPLPTHLSGPHRPFPLQSPHPFPHPVPVPHPAGMMPSTNLMRGVGGGERLQPPGPQPKIFRISRPILLNDTVLYRKLAPAPNPTTTTTTPEALSSRRGSFPFGDDPGAQYKLRKVDDTAVTSPLGDSGGLVSSGGVDGVNGRRRSEGGMEDEVASDDLGESMDEEVRMKNSMRVLERGMESSSAVADASTFTRTQNRRNTARLAGAPKEGFSGARLAHSSSIFLASKRRLTLTKRSPSALDNGGMVNVLSWTRQSPQGPPTSPMKPPQRRPRTPFAALNDFLDASNPRVFELPRPILDKYRKKEVRDRTRWRISEGIVGGSDAGGGRRGGGGVEFVGGLVTKGERVEGVKEVVKIPDRPLTDVEIVLAEVKTSPWCYGCGKCGDKPIPSHPPIRKDGSGEREMVRCDYCELWWHLGCLVPVLHEGLGEEVSESLHGLKSRSASHWPDRYQVDSEPVPPRPLSTSTRHRRWLCPCHRPSTTLVGEVAVGTRMIDGRPSWVFVEVPEREASGEGDGLNGRRRRRGAGTREGVTDLRALSPLGQSRGYARPDVKSVQGPVWMVMPGGGVGEVGEDEGAVVGVRFAVTEGRVARDFLGKVRELREGLGGCVGRVGVEELWLAAKVVEDGGKVFDVEASSVEREWLEKSLPLLEDILLTTTPTMQPLPHLNSPTVPDKNRLTPPPSSTTSPPKADTEEAAIPLGGSAMVDDEGEVVVSLERYLELLRIE
ncbi:hypothetical protein HDU67_004761, partial [Dinochytrium kinnereticum]